MSLEFDFEQLPTRIVFGRGRLDRLRPEVERLDAKAAMVVVDPGAADVREKAGDALGDLVADVFDEVKVHVPREYVEKAQRRAKEIGADVTVAVGGGSTIGLAKALAAADGPPLIAVPTTYSGSEMTPIYGITSGDDKRTSRDPRVLPKSTIYDPELTIGLPGPVTAGSGLNALAHCVEAMYAPGVSPVAAAVAERGAAALVAGLPKAVREPTDIDARSECLLGSHLAGWALAVSDMALHHRLCHVLGGMTGASHGDLNAVILPWVLAYNASGVPDVVSRVGAILETSDVAGGVQELATELGAPTSLEAIGVQAEVLPRAAAEVVERGGWNPCPLDESRIRSLLDGAYAGKRPLFDAVAA